MPTGSSRQVRSGHLTSIRRPPTSWLSRPQLAEEGHAGSAGRTRDKGGTVGVAAEAAANICGARFGSRAAAAADLSSRRRFIDCSPSWIRLLIMDAALLCACGGEICPTPCRPQFRYRRHQGPQLFSKGPAMRSGRCGGRRSPSRRSSPRSHPPSVSRAGSIGPGRGWRPGAVPVKGRQRANCLISI